ncbi:MAG TPA: hypothetical protein VE172_07385 [Stackebrandtia sp.]|uniref:hypothetical protein n=1 Tax=Stackebrandtia sp. TaxID=2023065 RepID=UPI002D372889|nr:hypothetical protein [Stackebrandtia sp.]HZE38622.1 hypothetical protein [Stackebrandtia sp.]
MAGERQDGPPGQSKKDDGGKINTLQIVAATGASTTAAMVANALGIYGTVTGVAVFSVISSVGTVLYLKSMHRTKEQFQKVVKAANDSATPLPRLRRATPRAAAPVPPPDATAVIPAQQRDAEPPAECAPTSVIDAAADDTAAPSGLGAWWRRNWKVLAISSVLVFALSIAALSAIGWLTGSDPSAYYRGQPPQSSSVEHDSSRDGTDGDPSSDTSDGTSRERSDSPSGTPSDKPSDRPSSQDKSTSDSGGADDSTSGADNHRDGPSSPDGE